MMHRRASRHVHSDMFFGFGFSQKNMFSPNNCEDSIAAARTSAEAKKKIKMGDSESQTETAAFNNR